MGANVPAQPEPKAAQLYVLGQADFEALANCPEGNMMRKKPELTEFDRRFLKMLLSNWIESIPDELSEAMRALQQECGKAEVLEMMLGMLEARHIRLRGQFTDGMIGPYR
ncbi:MAG: hypothetical protein ACRD3N_15755, partial [Terracidiphilus sp.]